MILPLFVLLAWKWTSRADSTLRLLLLFILPVEATFTEEVNEKGPTPFISLLQLVLCLGIFYIIVEAMLKAFNDHDDQMLFEDNHPKPTLIRRVQAFVRARNATMCYERLDQPSLFSSPPDREESLDSQLDRQQTKLSKNGKRRAQYARAKAKDDHQNTDEIEAPLPSPPNPVFEKYCRHLASIGHFFMRESIALSSYGTVLIQAVGNVGISLVLDTLTSNYYYLKAL